MQPGGVSGGFFGTFPVVVLCEAFDFAGKESCGVWSCAAAGEPCASSFNGRAACAALLRMRRKGGRQDLARKAITVKSKRR
jgi:hypothetical protein